MNTTEQRLLEKLTALHWAVEAELARLPSYAPLEALRAANDEAGELVRELTPPTERTEP